MKKFAFLILSLALFVGFAAAQESGVKGKVRDAKGGGIGGAKITARQDGKDVKSSTSDGNGNFQLTGLKSGTYNLVVDKSGYSAGLLYNVEVKDNKVRDLGKRLILTVDQGTLVIIKGSVFDPNGRSVSGAKVEVEKVLNDGSTKKVGSSNASYSGEFTFRFPEGAAKYRITAFADGEKQSKEVEVDSAAIYRLAITLNTDKDK